MAPPFRYAQRPPHNTVPPWHMEARKRHVVNDWKGAKIWLLARCGPCWPVIKLTRGAPRSCAPRNDARRPSLRAEGGAIQPPQPTDRFHGIAPLQARLRDIYRSTIV